MSFLLETPGLSGPFNACSPQAVTNAGFTAALGRVLKRPAVLLVPAPVLRLIMGEAADMLLTGQRCVPQALLKQGFEFKHPDLDMALADIIAEIRAS
jgi:NAD dependent epimerase/dehydratase family enzyme